MQPPAGVAVPVAVQLPTVGVESVNSMDTAVVGIAWQGEGTAIGVGKLPVHDGEEYMSRYPPLHDTCGVQTQVEVLQTRVSLYFWFS